MKHDHIEINGLNYRVEFNWNAITDFLESENLQLTDADNLKELKPRQITGLIYAGVVEGCRLDGTAFPFTKLDFGASITPQMVGELLLIYTRHTSTNSVSKKTPSDEPAESTKKKKMNLFRSRNSSS